MRIIDLALTGLLSVALAGCATAPSAPRTPGFVSRDVTVEGRTRGYQVFVPSTNAGGAHPPVILFLHGSGERGSDNMKQVQAGLGPYVRAHADTFPAIVVFPQVPDGQEWTGANADAGFAALEAATREFDGDRGRTYLTGMSMGGYGTWELAMMQPGRFAALVPVCGAIRPVSDERALLVTQVAGLADPFAAIAAKLRNVPTWIFHGAKDDVVPTTDDRALIAAFETVRAADARYTELPDANHNAWDPTYAQTPAMWAWLFAQHR